jgi:hypothetical protein
MTKLAVLLGVASLASAAPAHNGHVGARHFHVRAANSPIYPTGTATGPVMSTGTAPHPSPSSTFACGRVQEFFNPTLANWNSSGTDKYLSDWMKNNQSAIDSQSGTGGFASAFFEYAVGKTDVTCKIDGSTDCDYDACNNAVINALPNNDTANSFYVLQSIKNLHAYFQGVKDSFQMAALLGALSDDEWTQTFYKKPDGHDADDTEDHGITALKEIFNALATVIGAAAAFIAPETIPALAALEATEQGIVNGIKGSAAVIFAGSLGATNIAIKAANPGSSNFAHAADLGNAIGNVVQTAFTNIVNTNDDLMSGKTDSNGSNIADYLQGGGYLNASVNEVDTMSSFNAMLQGMAINQLWKQNKVFILGGGKCGDGQGIGSGPQSAVWCDNSTNTAWYLYFWQANDVISTTAHKWGWTAQPPGMDQLGNGSYANITVSKVIESSVRAYKQSGFNYTMDVANQRIMDAVTTGKSNPMADGAAWEGIFTIPVCNLTKTVDANLEKKENILLDFGHDNRPNWCGPICDMDLQQTKLFINASNMENFKSPKQACSNDPGYSSLS